MSTITLAPIVARPCPHCGNPLGASDITEVRSLDGSYLDVCAGCADAFVVKQRTDHLPELLARANVPQRFLQVNPATVPREVWAKLEHWRGDPDAVLLHGLVGTGKSYTAACMVRGLVLEGLPAQWVRVGDALDAMRDNLDGAGRYMERLRAVAYLVLDDLGAERQTDYAVDRISTLVAGRWDDARATIVTTNGTPTQLYELHARMASRLLGGLVVKMTGKDRRLQAKDGA